MLMGHSPHGISKLSQYHYRHKETNGTKALETDPNTCGYLIHDRWDVATVNVKRMDHSISNTDIIRQLQEKKVGPYPVPEPKINSKGIKNK